MRRLTLPLLALGLLASTARAGTPIVAFETSTTSVAEGDAVTITVTISEPPATYAQVTVVSQSNVAIENVDFVEVDQDLFWQAGDGTSRQFDVQTIADDIPEDFEWFDLRLTYVSPGAEVGEPSTMTVYIPNDDAGSDLFAWIDVDDAVMTSDGFTFEAEGGTTFEIPIRLNTIPNPPATVDFQSTFPPTSGTLTFNNTQEQILKIDAPLPKQDLRLVGTLTIALSPGRSANEGLALARGGDVTSVKLVSILPPLQELESCFFCWWTWLLHIRDPFFGTCPVECWTSDFCEMPRASAGTFDPNPGLAALRRYRDEILATSSAGLRFIELYETHATGAGRALLRDPRIAMNLVTASEWWLGPVQALLDGFGDQVTVTPVMQAELSTVLSRMADVADPALADALTTERERLQLDSIVGLTMIELQEQLETLGDVPTQRKSWSEIKARYR